MESTGERIMKVVRKRKRRAQSVLFSEYRAGKFYEEVERILDELQKEMNAFDRYL